MCILLLCRYRKVVGDSCQGGVEHQYMPLMYSCPVEERRDFILFATSISISSVDLNNNHYEMLISEGLHKVTYLDFDYTDNCVYWADRELSVIKRQCFGGHGHNQETILSLNLDTVEGLAYEWTAGQIYWIDSEAHSIKVARKNGLFRRVLYHGEDILHHPRSLVLDPLHGYLYWADWSSTNPRIVRAWMDGTKSSIHTVVNSSVVHSPSALAIDISAERLYWTDAGTHKIMSSDMDGKNQRVLVSGWSHLPNPFAIGLYKLNMYWSDQSRNGIMMAAKNSGMGVHVFLHEQDGITDLKIISNTLQRVHSACSRGNHVCSQLCLPKPHPSVHGQPNRTCKCADNVPSRILQQSGDEQCLCKSSQETMDENGNCVLTNGTTCAPGQFLCSNHSHGNHSRCIPSTWKCDHDNDCIDGSDEVDCPYSTCPPNNMACSDGRCIPLRWKCDTDFDCPDGSDEHDCDYPTCNNDQFQCHNHRCISKMWVCDFENDCHDGSDELNCTHSSCRSWEHRCGSGDCIGTAELCNGQNDCEDGSDEVNCTQSVSCSPWRFRCHNSSMCIQRTWLCDGEFDCDDHSDEIDCHTNATIISTTTSFPGSCSSSQFTCNNGFCVWWSSRCDGYNDCGDNSDETYCGYTTTSPMPTTSRKYQTTTSCPYQMFQCSNGQCISEYRRCDSSADCSDNSDEQNCGSSCGPDRFQCNVVTGGYSCIWLSYVCDGEPDCPNGDDEHYCNTTVVTCSPQEFRCVYSGGCIPKYHYCNGFPDCDDSSDEWDCSVNTTTVSPPISDCRNEAHSFRCSNYEQCVPWLFVCDSHSDCDDDSDEMLYECSKKVDLSVTVPSVTDRTISLSWDKYSGINVKYMVSYIEVNNHAFYSNTTLKTGTTAKLHSLHPLTKYAIGVYVVLGNRYMHGSVLRINTLQSVPSVPRIFHAQMITVPELKIALEWERPEQTYGKITAYLIHLKDTQSNAENEITCDSSHCHGSTIHFDLTEEYLSYNKTYTIWVSAVNDAGEGDRTAHKTVTFSDNTSQEMVGNIDVKNDVSSILLSWKPVTGATSYSVNMQYQSMREKQFSTTKPSINIPKLCPGNYYNFRVVPVFKTGLGNPSKVLHTRTKGVKVGPVTGVTATETDNTEVMVTFNSTGTKPSEYIVYYHEHSELPGEQVITAAKKVKTNSTFVTIRGLLSCERYFFRVAAYSPYCPLSYPVTLETSEDPKAAPKHIKFHLLDDLTSGTLSWDPPCDHEALHVDYVIKTLEVGSQKGPYMQRVPKTSDKGRQSYKLTHLTRGASYSVAIRTWIKFSRYSSNLTIPIPPYPEPLNLDMFPYNDKMLLQWEPNPKDQPPKNLFHGYMVYVSGSKKLSNGNDSFTKQTNNTKILLDIPFGYDYTVAVCYNAINGYYGKNATEEFPYFYVNPDEPSPASGKAGSTKIIAIVVPICVIVVILAIVLGVIIIRHRRLQRSFLAFANSHYDTRSGMTTFGSGDGLDDEDTPMIQGFSDDEPLITA
ncbi:sortilin-related receptor-like [Gigantopelta aegis]|uniref:sortilin-related receptor-like n=1 Tax=Gigantopelta aegis TaxID=1735272 RepID=UPI001B88C06A|nr:sortilin-related receptor-like [Gigantopelta aegis]